MNTMRAVFLNGYGGNEMLEIVETARPTPTAGQVLVRVHAAGVNYFEVKKRNGILKPWFDLPLPHAIGNDFAGEVVELGEGVTQFQIGDRVFGLSPRGGAWAEYIAIEAALVRPMPQTASYVEAAALPMVGCAAWMGLVDVAQVQAGQNVLIHGGSAGVGAAAVQIAKHLDARVTATCSTPNVERVREFGADEVIDYTQTDFRTCVRDVETAMDTVGGEMNLHTYEVMRPGGTVVLIQLTDPIEHQNRERLAKQYNVIPKPVLFDAYPEGLEKIAALVDAKKLNPNVRHVLPLNDVHRALEIAETGHPGGRIVLEVVK